MFKNRRYLIFTFGIAAVCLVTMCAIIQERDTEKEYRAQFSRNTRVFVPEIPASAVFAGEAAPLGLYYVREALDREIIACTYMHSSTILMFKRACRWFPVIEPILKKNGIPDDFKYLALAESNLVNVASPAGAEGYWQFLKPTGIKYGLEISEQVDERFNMEKATQAACNFFRESYDQFRSWTLVAASYNRGQEGLRKALDSQGAGNYYDLYLNDETSRYVFRILAMKEVYNHPVKYGFYLRECDLYPPVACRQVTVDSAVSSLPAFAKKLSVSYRVLRELNPWIRNYSLPNKNRKSYVFLVPAEGALKFDARMKKAPARETFFHDTLQINEVH